MQRLGTKCAPCPWRIRKSHRDRHLEQTTAMGPPSVAVKDGMCGWRLARSFSRSTAVERLVNAMFRRDRWPSSAIPGLAAPVATEALALPAQQRLGPDDRDGVQNRWK